MVPSGRPCGCALVTSWPSIVPTVRLTLRIGKRAGDRGAVVDRVAGGGDELVVERLLEAVVLRDRVPGAGAVGALHLGRGSGVRSRPEAFQWLIALDVSR